MFILQNIINFFFYCFAFDRIQQIINFNINNLVKKKTVHIYTLYLVVLQ
jgi:hypothetical protein